MTTVAYKRGILAADKQCTDGDALKMKITKLFRTKTHAIAFSGEVQEGLAFVKWYGNGKGKGSPLKTAEALVMSLETGECFHWEGGAKYGLKIEDVFTAIGSGAKVAIGAMAFGANAVEAIEVASAWDDGTGMGVNYARSKKARLKHEPQASETQES